MVEVTNQQLYAHYLNTMGIEVWVRRQPPAIASVSPPPLLETTTLPKETTISTPVSPLPVEPHKDSHPVMQDQPFSQTDTEETIASPNSQEPKSDTRQKALELIDWEVSACMACDLHKTRTQTVFGVGNPYADWMIIGEAPGADEDAQGEPFVGRAGKLLNSILYAIGLQRETVYIANILKCRPPDNRPPTLDEMACCTPFLNRQIALIKPKIILALGATAAQHLLATTTPIGELRGKHFEYADTGIPLVATYHPAYLLRRSIEKRKVWQDLQLACQIFAGQKG